MERGHQTFASPDCSMPFEICAFSVPKRDSTPLENQDAVLPRGPRTHGRRHFPWSQRVASKNGHVIIGIADGATEGILSGEWANIALKTLSKSKCEVRGVEDVAHLLSQGIATWKRYHRLRTMNGARSLTALPKWLEDQSIDQGAFTTFCVAWFGDDNSWIVASVGDSCVFQERHGELISAYPLSLSSEFSNSPYLLGSQVSNNRELSAHIKVFKGNWEDSDHFYFATDALAFWILKQHEQGNLPLRNLKQFSDCYADEFPEFVVRSREIGEIRNDDTTLIRAQFTPDFR